MVGVKAAVRCAAAFFLGWMNGVLFETISDEIKKSGSSQKTVVIAPNGYAVGHPGERPRVHRSRESAIGVVNVIIENGGCSTCGGEWRREIPSPCEKGQESAAKSSDPADSTRENVA